MHRTLSPAAWGLPDARIDPPEPVGPDDLLDEPAAREAAKDDLLADSTACAYTIAEQCFEQEPQPLVDGLFLSDEASFADCMAMVLSSCDGAHIVAAVYRLRELIVESKDGREFIAARAKELLDAQDSAFAAIADENEAALREDA